jgi:DNA-binding NtrC family response regulator
LRIARRRRRKATRVADSGSSLTLECAGDGQSGARMVEEGLHQGRPFSVAFVDMRMPTGWDGLATLKRLHAIDPALQTVICTAYADHSWDEIIEEIPDLDRLLVLKKPFDVIEVQQMTIALCRKWALARELDRSMSELRSERARLQGVIDNSDARICLKNRQGVFVLVNRQLA